MSPDAQSGAARRTARRLDGIGAALDAAGLAERPVAVLDLDAFDANADDLARRAAGVPIRVASKSLRVRALIERACAHPGMQGVLAYTLPEALWLAENGVRDIVVAYPTVDRAAIARLAASETARAEVTVMVDCVAHLDLIEDAARGALGAGQRVRVAIELDAAYAPHARLRFGALRSPIADAGAAVTLVREITRRPGLELDGIMAYEGQIAGVGNAGSAPYAYAVRAMQKLSAAEIARRRAEVVAAVADVAPLRFVNAGGTGSIETSGAEEAVTEIAAGSGLIGPALFDGYRAFAPSPALFLGFSVVRRPGPRVATLLGGGWIASGVPGPDRLPALTHPAGLRYAPQEAAGEVQTPVMGEAAERLRIGDTVWLRPAKAGEAAEHAPSYVLLAGERPEVFDVVPTYRGEGRMFL